MIFDWPEVTSRHASQLVALIPGVVSPSTYFSLRYARALPALTFVVVRRRRRSCVLTLELCAIAHRVDDARE